MNLNWFLEFFNNMQYVIMNFWYVALAALVLLIIGVMRLGLIRGGLVVLVGNLMVLNSFYYLYASPRAVSDFAVLVSLFLGAVGIILYGYALFIADPKN